MYYIVNQTNHILAADNALLTLLCVESMEELQKSIGLNDIEFTSSSDDKLEINTLEETFLCKTTIHTLSSLLGDIKLIEVNVEQEDEDSDKLFTLENRLISEDISHNHKSTKQEDENEDEIDLEEELKKAEEEEAKKNDFSIFEDKKEKVEDEIFSIFEDKKEEKEDEVISIFDDEPLTFEEKEEVEEALEVEETKEENSEDDLISLLDDEPLTFEEKEEVEEALEVEETKEENSEDDLISLLDDEPLTFEEKEEVEEEETKEENSEDDLISLLDDEPLTFEEKEEAEEEVEEALEVEDKTDNILTKNISSSKDPSDINIEEISKKIGISVEDYTEFLNEYADTALTLEDDLKSEDENKKSHAVKTLTHLSDVLHISSLKPILENIQNSNSNNKIESIQSLYTTLSIMTNRDIKVKIQEDTVPELAEEMKIEEDIEIETPIELKEPIEENTITFKDDPVEQDILMAKIVKESIEEIVEPVEEAIEESEINPNSFGTIDLSDVKPIHFDFQLNQAANELSLPVELIKEFVVDFIDQGHEETEKMLKAYEEGDLDAIQKIGHLLKGTSSNLRINPLADTLYKIQFCEDSSDLDVLIKDYWGHFLSFENQINHLVKS